MYKYAPFVLLLAAISACDKDSRASTASEPASSPAPVADTWSTPDSARKIQAPLTQAPDVPPRIFREKPAHVLVDLEVIEVEKEIAPGSRYMVWTFGGQVPGKMIRVRQGDVVELHLKNHPSSKLPHNIDLHAVTGPGGGAEATLTAPGHESSFTFRALNPGLYVYHCATAPVPMHVANGMYGLILVEPPGGLPPVDREFYVMQGEFYTQGEYHAQGLQAFDLQKGIDEKPTYVVFNGAEGALVGESMLKARTGERVRIFFGNGGLSLASNFHVIGEIFDRVYYEGGSKAQENVQTTLVPVGGSAIIDFTVDVPGEYILVDHALFRAFNKGAVGKLEVTGMNNVGAFSGRQMNRSYTPSSEVAAAAPAANDGGATTYANTCAACHQANGQGLPPTFPPLASSDYLASASKDKLIGHVLHGLQGPISVNGQPYNGVMPPLGHLSNADVAKVLTYVRSSFGNKLDAVTIEEVQRVRSAQASVK